MAGRDHQMHLLQGCLLIWTLISASFAQETEPTPVVVTNGMTEAVSMPQSITEETGISGSNMPEVTPTMPDTSIADDTSSPGSGNTISCQSFHCMGADCYTDEKYFVNATQCMDGSYCEVLRHNSSHYEAKCSKQCTNLCPQNDITVEGCAEICCNEPFCLMPSHSGGMNGTATAAGDTSDPVTTATTTTPTTTTTIAYSDKKCRSFMCTGTDCFKAQTSAATKQCRVGINHCELQKRITGSTVTYEAGCSNTCATSTHSCATITNANCFHECCNATVTACCMKLDGQVHFNDASQLKRGSYMKLISCVIVVLFTSRFFSVL
ncbi:uncharacterized protein O3C94_000563 [Discoglossus pictus]